MAELWGLLADEDRLRVFSAIALGARSVPDIADHTGMDPRTVVKALQRLEAGGVVANDGPIKYTVKMASKTWGNEQETRTIRSGQTDDFIPHSSLHWPRKRPPHAAPPRTASLRLRCTLERKAAYWAACTSNTSGT